MKNKFLLVGFSLLLALIISIFPGSQVNKVSAEPVGCVPGPHHGTIAASETWCKADNPHFVDYGVTVPEGVALTIEPGVIVKFYSGASLSVVGSLIANGSSIPGEQILFTSDLPSPGQGSWQGISASSGSTLQISYCEMAYAGQLGFDFGSLTIRTASASISHCRIHDGLGTALFLDNPGITPQLNDVEIDHYTGLGIFQNNISMNPRYQNIHLHDNAWDGLQISGGNTDRDVTLDGSLAAFNGTPIYINNSIKIIEGTTMTITPGTTLMVNGGIAVPSASRLAAEGTLAAPVRFTSWKDVPQPGDWAGISASFGATLQLSYCELAYAGLPGFDFGSLTIRTGGATVSHCRIHDGVGTALFLDNPGITPQFNDVEIDHYTGAGLYQNKISMNPVYQNIRLHDTTTNGLLISGGLTDQDITLDGSPAAFNGAPIYMGYGITVGSGTTMTITPGTTLKNNEGISVAAGAALVAEGIPTAPIIFTAITDPPVAGSWGGINAAPGSALMLSYCEVAYAGKAGGAFGAVQIETSNSVVNQCRIHDSSRHGIYIKAASPFHIWNNVLTDNDGAALDVESGSHLQALQTTLARNQVGFYVSSGSAALTNSIVANNTIGVQQAYAGSISLTNTLFQGNVDAIVGAVTDTNHIDGVAAFETDGYHLSKPSDAIDTAVNAGVNMDIDGDPRPVGFGPDLGADEYRDAISPVFNKDGGRLTYTDKERDSTEVIVPPGAVKQDTVLIFKVIGSVSPPSTYKQTGHAFHLDGYQGGFLILGLVFDTPVRITLHYSDADVIGLDRKTLTLWYWDGSMWSDAACGAYERHPTQNWLTVPVCHLSMFGFFAQPPYSVFIPMIRR